MRFKNGLVLVCSIVCLATIRPATAQTLDDVISQWKEREAAIASLRAEWTEVRTEAKGARFDAETDGPLAKRLGFDPDKSIPETEISNDAGVHFLADRNRMRVEAISVEFSAKSQSFEPHSIVSNYDGQLSQLLQLTGERPSLILYPDKYNSEVVMLYLEPVLLYFTPFHERGGIDADKLTLNHTVELNGKRCLLVVEQRNKDSQKSYWLDLDCKLLPVRVSFERRGVSLYQIDITYKDAPQYPMPTGWTRTTFKRKRIVRVDKATVTEFELDPKFEDNAFQLVPPQNTLVSDLRGDHTQELLEAIAEGEKKAKENQDKRPD